MHSSAPMLTIINLNKTQQTSVVFQVKPTWL